MRCTVLRSSHGDSQVQQVCHGRLDRQRGQVPDAQVLYAHRAAAWLRQAHDRQQLLDKDQANDIWPREVASIHRHAGVTAARSTGGVSGGSTGSSSKQAHMRHAARVLARAGAAMHGCARAMHDCTLQARVLAERCMTAPEAKPYRGPWCRIGLAVYLRLPVKDALQGVPVQHIFCTQHEHLQATAQQTTAASYSV